MNKPSMKKRLMTGAAALLLASGTLVATTSLPANAGGSVVPNFYECDPDTGWCYQTNPPYNPNFPQSCRWNENVHNSWGMWYTGCDAGYWRPYVYA
jgi:hypothetical protein